MPDSDPSATNDAEPAPEHVVPSRGVRTSVLIVCSLAAAICAVFGISAVATFAL